MLSPEEKANELIEKFYSADETNSLSDGWICKKIARQCAAICCEEIINTLNKDIRDLDVRGNVLLDLIKYWNQVLNHINQISK